MTETMPGKLGADAAVGELFGAALIGETELWMNTHKELFANVAMMMESWLQLHRAAIEASSRALHRLSACSNLTELLQLQQEWMSDYWGWATAIEGTGADGGVHAARKAATRLHDPVEAGRTDILVRRSPAKNAAETVAAAE